MPLDTVVSDMDWHNTCFRRTYGSEDEKSMDFSHNWPCWSGFSFDRKHFPNATAFFRESHARGIHNALNLHFQSGLQPEEDAYPAFSAALALPPTASHAAFDPLNHSYSAAFHHTVLGPLERQGVDLWWLDWQQGEHQFAGSPTPEINPTWWLNHVYYTQPDGRSQRAVQPHEEASAAFTLPDGAAARRRGILHRWGGLGNHRYPLGFSGDVKPDWASLTFQPHFTASAANVLFGYWSHDIGGFYEPIDAELYTRWVQFGALSPVFRAHGFRSADIVKRFWLYPPHHFEAMRDALRLRLEILPHLYNGAAAAHAGGPPLLRPLYHEWPAHDDAYTHPGEYLLGDGVIAAPVTAPFSADAPLAPVKLWVPPGEWALHATGAAIDGPTSVDLRVALDEIPILVRAGSVLWAQPPPHREWPHRAAGAGGRWLGRAQRRPRCVQASVWMPRSARAAGGSGGEWTGGGELYEDDGWSEDYQRGVSTRRALRWRLTAAALTVEVDAATGCGGGGGEPGQPPEEASARAATQALRVTAADGGGAQRWRRRRERRAVCRCRDARAVARGGRARRPLAPRAVGARIVVWLFGVDDGAPLGHWSCRAPAAALAAAALQRAAAPPSAARRREVLSTRPTARSSRQAAPSAWPPRTRRERLLASIAQPYFPGRCRRSATRDAALGARRRRAAARALGAQQGAGAERDGAGAVCVGR